MRNHDSPTLFDLPESNDQERRTRLAFEYAYKICRPYRRGKPLDEVAEDVVDDLLYLAAACDLTLADERWRLLTRESRTKFSALPKPRELRDLYRDMFQPPLPPVGFKPEEGEQPTVECELCKDLGWRLGTSELCACSAGEKLKRDPVLVRLSKSAQSARPLPRAPSLRFSSDGRIRPPKRPPRPKN